MCWIKVNHMTYIPIVVCPLTVIIWAGAVRQKTEKKQKKSVKDRRTDQQTDRRTERPTKLGVESHITRLKKENRKQEKEI